MSSRWNALFLAVGSLVTISTTAQAATAPTIIIDEAPLFDFRLLFGILLGVMVLSVYNQFQRHKQQDTPFYFISALPIAVCFITSLWFNAAELSFVLLSLLLLIGFVLDKRHALARIVKKTPPPPTPLEIPEPPPEPPRTEDSIRRDIIIQIGHEIRTPLNGILGMSELLLDMPLSERQRDYVQTIQRAGNTLLIQFNGLFDSVEQTPGSYEIEDVQLDFYALIDDCINTLKNHAEQKSVGLIKFLPPSVPRYIRGDINLLRRILLELLERAIRHSPRGDEVVLLIGIDSTESPHIRIVIQTNNITTDAHQTAHDDSSLNHIQQWVQDMRGQFGIEDTIQSLTYWFNFPLLSEPVGSSFVDPYIVLQDARILIISPDETTQKVLQQQCSSWNMDVFCATRGNDALALMRVRSNLYDPFDIVLFEQDMPSMSGLQLAARIRSDALIERDIPLVMLGHPQLKQEALLIPARNADINYVLTKPVAGYALKATLAKALERQRTKPKLTAAELLLPHAEHMHVLVAEDNNISTKVTQGMLQRLGIQPDLASNGEEALHKLYQQHYDLVLMDCEMPILDGFSTTQRLREWETQQHRKHTPVIALTAHAFHEYRERAQSAGMDGHLAKPVDLLQLRQAVERWIPTSIANT